MLVEFNTDGEYGFITTEKVIPKIRSAFAADNPNPKAKEWAKKIHSITPLGRFNIGLWEDIFLFLRQKYKNDLEIKVTKEFKEIIKPMFSHGPVANLGEFEYYYYQREAIEEMLRRGRGIIKLPTGAGKGLVMAGFCYSYLLENPNAKIVLHVPNLNLLNQLYDEFINDYGVTSITKWSGKDTPDMSKNIVIVNTNFLVINEKRALDAFEDFDVYIQDEVHKLKRGNKTNNILDGITTNVRFGLTGTIPKEKEDEWNIKGKIGPILYSKSSKEIREETKSISEVAVKVIRLSHNEQPEKYICLDDEDFDPTGQYNNEQEFLYNLPWRNDFIMKMANRLKGNCLVLVDRIFHGELLLDELTKGTDKQVYFISGDMPVEDRMDIIDLMEERDDIICISMDTIFSTGISVKNLKFLIFVCIGKSFTKVLQSIGRVLRLHENKVKAIILDVSDNTKYSTNHLEERIAFYDEEEINYEIRKIKEDS